METRAPVMACDEGAWVPSSIWNVVGIQRMELLLKFLDILAENYRQSGQLAPQPGQSPKGWEGRGDACRASRWIPGEVNGNSVRVRPAGHSEESGGQQERHGTQLENSRQESDAVPLVYLYSEGPPDHCLVVCGLIRFALAALGLRGRAGFLEVRLTAVPRRRLP
uniref:Uncharacterized protein n=1 Tax=Rangifer tarandus platyrhynchus TaxID=3082113 RepID=A0ACB0FMW9_RANTA|nr:unnamed protein product [Rangifer tarandus platyrhynchus]